MRTAFALFLFLLSVLIVFGPFFVENDFRVYGIEDLAKVELGPDQSFVGAPGSTIEYNTYLVNTGKSLGSCSIAAFSDQNYLVEVWRDVDGSGQGDVQLFPGQGTVLELEPDEMATLIVRVHIPSDAIEGLTDVTTISAVKSDSSILDSVYLSTAIDSSLLFPSDWIQLGSDVLGDAPPNPANPERIDLLALYYCSNGTDVFFRLAEADVPTSSFSYSVFLDTIAGGQEIGDEYYDFAICSDEIIRMWDGSSWIDSGYSCYVTIEGTSIVLSAELENLDLGLQDINILAWSATKDNSLKDNMGPFLIPIDNISEIPFILIPIVFVAIYYKMTAQKPRKLRK